MDNKKYLEWGLIGIFVILGGIFGQGITREIFKLKTARQFEEYSHPNGLPEHFHDPNILRNEETDQDRLINLLNSQRQQVAGRRSRRKRNRSRKK